MPRREDRHVFTKEERDAVVSKFETIELTNAERDKLGLTYIQLEVGTTNYILEGQEDGPHVVLVPGFSVPMSFYSPLSDTLTAAGYRVLRYDLLGRGGSDRPHVTYTPELYAAQLEQLTRALFGDRHIVLVGASMGAIIVTQFCMLYPGRVSKLVLLEPAGLDTHKPTFWMKLLFPSRTGYPLLRLAAPRVILSVCEENARKSELFMKVAHDMLGWTDYKGYLWALHSSAKDTIFAHESSMPGFQSVARQGLDTLVVWGTEDKIVPYSNVHRLKEVLPNAEYVTYEGCGHDFPLKEYKRLGNTLLQYLVHKQ